MNYGSVCSGVEAATVAWEPLGWKAQWFSEIEPFPCKVLKYHYPQVPNLGDMLKIEKNEIFRQSNIDVLVGGTPCQSFSLAGLRGGMADERGNLALEFCRILTIKRPQWFLWENVPGVFSSFSDETGGKGNDGNGPGNERTFTETADFATLLAAFRECGYSCAWRVFDSQYFGVPQRRRRVFVVGYFGNDWRPPFAVLFDRASMYGNPPPSKRKGEGVALALVESPSENSGGESSLKQHELAGTFAAGAHPGGFNGQDISNGLFAVYSIMPMNSGKDYTARQVEVSQPVLTNGNQSGNQGGDYVITLDCRNDETNDEISGTLQAKKSGGHSLNYINPVFSGITIRRLTPLECERLQGFPDHYTAIPGAKDAPRYKAMGNSMTTYVMRWIGARIDKVDKIFKHG